MRGLQPGHLHVELAFFKRHCALQDSVGDRGRDTAAVPGGALHHYCDDILRMVIWRETGKPCHIFLVAALAGLRGAGFSSDLHILQTCSATGSAVVINHLPKTPANQFNLISRNFMPQIRSHAWRWHNRITLLI